MRPLRIFALLAAIALTLCYASGNHRALRSELPAPMPLPPGLLGELIQLERAAPFPPRFRRNAVAPEPTDEWRKWDRRFSQVLADLESAEDRDAQLDRCVRAAPGGFPGLMLFWIWMVIDEYELPDDHPGFAVSGERQQAVRFLMLEYGDSELLRTPFAAGLWDPEVRAHAREANWSYVLYGPQSAFTCGLPPPAPWESRLPPLHFKTVVKRRRPGRVVRR